MGDMGGGRGDAETVGCTEWHGRLMTHDLQVVGATADSHSTQNAQQLRAPIPEAAPG